VTQVPVGVSGWVTEVSAGVSIVIPNWNGARWLPGCLAALARQQHPPDEVIIVDNGSTDGSLEYLHAEHPEVRVVEMGHNTGFARAANRGIELARTDLVALINTDVELAEDWVARMSAALRAEPAAGAVASKMLVLDDPTMVYDAGDILRRDGACEQRGRFMRDDGRFNTPGDVFGACAGAAVYRREAVLGVGGFDERYFAYLEDVDLALALRLDGWTCLYEPAVSLHAGEGSSRQLRGKHNFLVTRNTVLLVAKWFPVRWLPYVAYRQLGWAWHALRDRRLSSHLRALAAALPMLPGALTARRRPPANDRGRIDSAIPKRPFRGPQAGGHPSSLA
jgi:GT2 family glycosyltransferase